jgi:hypothetical protein
MVVESLKDRNNKKKGHDFFGNILHDELLEL